MYNDNVYIERIMREIGQGLGTRFEFECYDIGHLYTLAHFAERGLIKAPFLIQGVFGILGGIGADPRNLAHMVTIADSLFGDDYVFSAFAAGRHQMPFCTQSALLGGNVRVGLEDSLYIGRGELAKSNADQVTKIRGSSRPWAWTSPRPTRPARCWTSRAPTRSASDLAETTTTRIDKGKRKIMTDKGVFLVTGGSRGIGEAIARSAAAEGYFVLLTYVGRADRAQAVVEAIRAAGGQADAVQADTGVPADVARMFEAADKHGRLSALIYNGGITGGVGLLADQSDATLARSSRST
jgi:hypothetical protein